MMMRYYQTRYSILVILELINEIGVNIPIELLTQFKRISESDFSGIKEILQWELDQYFPIDVSPDTAQKIELIQALFLLLKSRVVSEGVSKYESIKLSSSLRSLELSRLLKNLFSYLAATYTEYNTHLGKTFYELLHTAGSDELYETIWKEHSEIIQKYMQGESLETKTLQLILKIV